MPEKELAQQAEAPERHPEDAPPSAGVRSRSGDGPRHLGSRDQTPPVKAQSLETWPQNLSMGIQTPETAE
jgi:hypothetical protein